MTEATSAAPTIVGPHPDPAQAEAPDNIADGDLQAERGRRETLALAAAVAEGGDAQALAVAALLRTAGLPPAEDVKADASAMAKPGMDDTVRDWLDTAERQAPDDVVRLVVAIYLERFDEGRRQALIARWRALEPDNLVPILFLRLPDSALFDAAMTANVYDSHYDDFLRAVFTSLMRPSIQSRVRLRAAQEGVLPEEYVAALANNAWFSTSMPSLDPISSPCRKQPLDEVRRAPCRRLAEILVGRSDTLLSELIGVAIMKRHANTSAELREIEERHRTLRWITRCSSESYERDPRTHMKRYAQILKAAGAFTEQSMLRQFALEAGYPPVPPPGWQPGQEH